MVGFRVHYKYASFIHLHKLKMINKDFFNSDNPDFELTHVEQKNNDV